ncbi:hypothetical protein ACFWGL_17045 [Streptomyces sp. NPDC060286]|uniref:hypothetical protein n=1 Tax=unclassified Streptomyces TaxID=2593676 RepID=UPI0035DB6B6A
MDRAHRAARLRELRKAPRAPRIRRAPVPETVWSDLDGIDAATTDPTIRAATARIRAALGGDEQPTTKETP